MGPFEFVQKPDGCTELPGYAFTYRWVNEDDEECTDTGFVRYVLSYGNGFYEFYLEAKSGVTVCVGPKMGGKFISIPAFGVCSEGTDFDDIFWNNEQLGRHLSSADASAIAYALWALKKHIT